MSSAQILSTVKDGHTQKVSHINSWTNLVCTGAMNRHCRYRGATQHYHHSTVHSSTLTRMLCLLFLYFFLNNFIMIALHLGSLSLASWLYSQLVANLKKKTTTKLT